jgi:hypothetical protein
MPIGPMSAYDTRPGPEADMGRIRPHCWFQLSVTFGTRRNIITETLKAMLRLTLNA